MPLAPHRNELLGCIALRRLRRCTQSTGQQLSLQRKAELVLFVEHRIGGDEHRVLTLAKAPAVLVRHTLEYMKGFMHAGCGEHGRRKSVRRNLRHPSAL